MMKLSIALFTMMSVHTNAFVSSIRNNRLSPAMMELQSFSNQAGPENALLGRRFFGQGVVSSAAALILMPDLAVAISSTGTVKDELEGGRVYFKGKVKLRSNIISAKNAKSLIVSARPKNPTNVPTEILASGQGDIPAVFTAILPKPDSFPFSFQLTSGDLTPEGKFGLLEDSYWWAEDTEWEISACVDMDDTFQTGARNGLIGRAYTVQMGENKSEQDVTVVVQPRGLLRPRA